MMTFGGQPLGVNRCTHTAGGLLLILGLLLVTAHGLTLPEGPALGMVLSVLILRDTASPFIICTTPS
jgi:hypothetical protein